MTLFSIETLAFLLAVPLIFRTLPQRLRPFLLLAASLLFYGLVQPGYLPVLLLTTVFVWAVTRHMDTRSGPSRRRWLIAGIIAVVTPLLVFKYSDLFLRTVTEILNMDFSPIRLLAPLGISFYTFRMISYLADVFHGRCKAEPDLRYLTLYISWFPQILSGPIERAGDLIHQLKHPALPDLNRGMWRILGGLFKKMVIAERMALFTGPLFLDPGAHDGITLIIGAIFFYIQIYCDFAGYTDLAIGVSELLGIRSAENFDYPMASRSVSEFWRRWHMTLSFWLRDYIFLPLSYAGIRRTNRWGHHAGEMAVYVMATTVTMFVAGLWHGAGWNFVIWGLIHAFYMSFSHVTRRTRKRIRRFFGLHRHRVLRHGIQWGITFCLITLSWIFFRAGSVAQGLSYLSHMSLMPPAGGWAHLGFTSIFAMAWIVGEIGSRRRWWQRTLPSGAAARAVLYAFLLTLLIVFSVDGSNEFIYFQF